MNLTGGPFIAFAGILAIVVVVVAVRLLGSFPGRSARDLGIRTGLVVSTQAAVLFAILVIVNSWGEFYASWGDLLGSDHSRAKVSQDHKGAGATLAPITEDSTQLKPAGGGGRIDQVTINGPRSGLTSIAYVLMPPQYLTDKTRNFPAVLVLSSNPRTLVTQINPQHYPAVYVVVAPTMGQCVDAPGGTQAETFLTQDVTEGIGYVPAAGDQPPSGYRVTSQWGVIGDASNGYCAAKLVLRRSDRFVAGASVGTSYDAPPGDLYGASNAMRQENTLVWRLKNRQPQPPGSLLLAPNDQARQLAGLAQDPLHIELAADGTTLPGALSTLQRWVGLRLAVVIGTAGDPSAVGGALPSKGTGFKGHRGRP